MSILLQLACLGGEQRAYLSIRVYQYVKSVGNESGMRGRLLAAQATKSWDTNLHRCVHMAAF